MKPLSIFPLPKKLTVDGHTPLGESFRSLHEVLKRLSFTEESIDAFITGRPSLLHFDRTDDLGAEGYELRVGEDKIELRYSSLSGARYGLHTLKQVLNHASVAGSVPLVDISDEPAFAMRGYMLDISRCKVPTMESLYQLIDQLCLLRYNQFQLYTEHTFAYEGHEQVWGQASPITAEEIKLLDAYCSERGIELVPNQNSFGHMERWLRYPEYKHLAESPDGFTHPLIGEMPWGTTLYPSQASLDFVDSLYDQLLPLFRSSYLNIGGDEPWELGQGRSKERTAKEGKHAVYFEFLEKLIALAKEHGKTPMFWADILLEDPKYVARLPKDIIGLVWGYEANHPFPEQLSKFVETGTPYCVVPGTSSWNTLSGRWYNAKDNILSAVENGLKYQAKGILLTDWGDNGHHQFPFVTTMPLVYCGAVQWNSAGGEVDNLLNGLSILYPETNVRQLYDAYVGMGEVDNVFANKVFNRTVLNNKLFYPQDYAKNPASETELKMAQERLNALSLPELDEITQREFSLTRKLLLFAAGAKLEETPEELVNEYEALWLSRNREGGLAESKGKLIKGLEQLIENSFAG